MREIRIERQYETSIYKILGVMLFSRDEQKAIAVFGYPSLIKTLETLPEPGAAFDPMDALLNVLQETLKSEAQNSARHGMVAGDVLNLAYANFLKTGKCTIEYAITSYKSWALTHKYKDGETIARSRQATLNSIEAVKPAIHLWAAFRFLASSPDWRNKQFSRDGLPLLIAYARGFESFILRDEWRKFREGSTFVKYNDLYRFTECPIHELRPNPMHV
jgi:hypothetical protein